MAGRKGEVEDKKKQKTGIGNRYRDFSKQLTTEC